MASRKKLPEITDQEIKELIHEIIKRIILFGLILIALGILIILLIHFFYPGA